MASLCKHWDQPIATGQTWSAANRTVYELPSHKTKTVMYKSQTVTGEHGQSNELTLEDAPGREEVFLHAQKDKRSIVENDQNIEIRHDRNVKVTHDHQEQVGHDRTTAIANNEITEILSDSHKTVLGEWIEETNKTHHLNVSNEIIIEAKNKISLKVGSHAITLEPSAITIGPDVNIGQGVSPSVPIPPMNLADVEYARSEGIVPEELTEFELNLTSDDGFFVPKARYIVTFKNGQTMEGQLDNKGRKYIYNAPKDMPFYVEYPDAEDTRAKIYAQRLKKALDAKDANTALSALALSASELQLINQVYRSLFKQSLNDAVMSGFNGDKKLRAFKYLLSKAKLTDTAITVDNHRGGV